MNVILICINDSDLKQIIKDFSKIYAMIQSGGDNDTSSRNQPSVIITVAAVRGVSLIERGNVRFVCPVLLTGVNLNMKI